MNQDHPGLYGKTAAYYATEVFTLPHVFHTSPCRLVQTLHGLRVNWQVAKMAQIPLYQQLGVCAESVRSPHIFYSDMWTLLGLGLKSVRASPYADSHVPLSHRKRMHSARIELASLVIT